MMFWSNISTILSLAALILLILCIISFFKKNGKAMKYGRPAVICFILSFLVMATSTEKTDHPIINFFANVCLILFIFFLVLAILSIIKKTGMAKKQFLITAVLFIAFGVLTSIAAPSTGKVTAKDKKVTEKKEVDEKAQKQQEEQKRQAEEQTQQQQEEQKRQTEEQTQQQQEEQKRQTEEQTQKQQEEQKRQAEEQAQMQQEEQKRQAEEQARKQQEEQKRQAEEQAQKQQEEQKRQAEEQAQKQQEEQKRQAEEQARKQQEEQKRQAEEQARKQQEQQTMQQSQPTESNSNVYYKNCTEVKNAGKAPIYSGQPGYSHKLDRDGDGVACER
ncbi:excalibur calcium-binding domain-containing protein [Bacillus sp. C1]